MSIQIIPIPGISFKDNIANVTEPINDNGQNFNHMGKYIASSSSYSSKKHKAENAFNDNDEFWQCDYSKNTNYNKKTFPYLTPYSQNPYVKSEDGSSVFQGGGFPSVTWSTPVTFSNSVENVEGEWLQIQLPKPIFFYRYTITTPEPIGKVNTFPNSFIIVGSNNGNTWNFVDQKIVKTESLKHTYTFNTTTLNSYSYFRLIITGLVENIDIISISNWSLFGNMKSKVNPEAFTNQFNNIIPINEINQQYVSYNTYQPTFTNKENENENENVVNNTNVLLYKDDNNIIIIPFILTSLLFIFIYNKK
jgi:hypothetical protein